MSATFWIETVETQLEIPVWHVGDAPLIIQAPAANQNAQEGPKFQVTPPKNIAEKTEIQVTFTQIQYVQTVFLNFAGLTWPHVSCATLIPSGEIEVGGEVFGK